MPLGGGQQKSIKRLYKDARNYEEEIKETRDSVDLPITDPHIVVDPRRVGYNYLSYAFIESGSELPDISDDEKSRICSDFQDNTINNGSFIGISLGDFDIIHRRTEQKQYTHAKFAVDTIDDENVNYVQSIETYPIWAIARWHGKNIPLDKMFKDSNFDGRTKIEREVIYELYRGLNKTEEEIANSIRTRIKSNRKSIIGEQEIPERFVDKVDNTLAKLERNKIIFEEGSIGVKVSATSWTHLIVGIKVEEIGEEKLKQERERIDEVIGDRSPLPTEIIMYKIREEFDDVWEMPYIVSGVGQNWADILVEMHIEDIQNMDTHAQNLRKIPGIKSTRTHLITHEAINEPLVVNDPEYID